MTERLTAMREALARALPDAELAVEDFSPEHAGHAGAGVASHIRVRAVWEGFAGMTRVARERMVHAVVREAWAGGLHALTCDLRAPSEGH